MAFTCFECHMADQQDGQKYLQEMAVARDAEMEGRKAEALEIRLRAASMMIGSADYHISVYLVGHNEAWPGVQVWLPAYGVSIGECEDCSKRRPCVNV